MRKFTDAQFMTAKEKELVLKHWEKFVKGSFQRQDFSGRIYKHLTLHCSFIAHYNINGFYETYFQNPEDTIHFMSQFDSDKGCVSVEYGDTYWIGNGNDVCQSYYDINRAMVEVMGRYKADLYRKLSNEAKEKDLAAARALLAKHGYKFEAIHPTRHDVPHNSEFCNKCCHEAYCEVCRTRPDQRVA